MEGSFFFLRNITNSKFAALIRAELCIANTLGKKEENDENVLTIGRCEKNERKLHEFAFVTAHLFVSIRGRI